MMNVFARRTARMRPSPMRTKACGGEGAAQGEGGGLEVADLQQPTDNRQQAIGNRQEGGGGRGPWGSSTETHTHTQPQPPRKKIKNKTGCATGRRRSTLDKGQRGTR